MTSRRGSPTFFGDGTHLEVLSDLADEALEGELADEQLGGLLVLPVALKGARDGRVSDVHTEDLARETNPKKQPSFQTGVSPNKLKNDESKGCDRAGERGGNDDCGCRARHRPRERVATTLTRDHATRIPGYPAARAPSGGCPVRPRPGKTP